LRVVPDEESVRAEYGANQQEEVVGEEGAVELFPLWFGSTAASNSVTPQDRLTAATEPMNETIEAPST
jgi:hypothetical protein